nr:MAG TPA: hypothetical protein [Caudoviricetes sp.]
MTCRNKVLCIVNDLVLSSCIEQIEKSDEISLFGRESNGIFFCKVKTILVQEIWLNMKNVKNFKEDIPLWTADAILIITYGAFSDTKSFGKLLLCKTSVFSCLLEAARKGHKRHLLKSISGFQYKVRIFKSQDESTRKLYIDVDKTRFLCYFKNVQETWTERRYIEWTSRRSFIKQSRKNA